MQYAEIKNLTIFNTPVIKLGLFLVISCVLYAISLENYLLFRIIVNLFNVIIAYMVFIIVWKSKVISENRYLTFIGTALFFIACLGFLRAFSYKEMGVFPEYGTNLPVQLWIVMRYLGSISFFVAPLLLTQVSGNEKRNEETGGNDQFAQKVFFIYAIITAVLMLSIFHYRNFPACYIEGYGLTDFKIFSEYIISFLFIGSLVLLYRKRDRFEGHVYRILTAVITISIFSEVALIYYTNTEELLNFIGLTLNALSFYLIHIAIVETGLEEPYSLLFRELKSREETLRRETMFLKDDQGRIYRMLGVEECIPESKPVIKRPQDNTAQYNSSLMQGTHGLIYFRLNEKRVPVSMEGPVEEITGYNREDFIYGKMKWAEIVVPEDHTLFNENMRMLELNPDASLELEYRIRRKDGETRWVKEIIHFIPVSKRSGASERFQGFIYDITQRKVAEETFVRNEEVRIKEIHHRIKNNLQVISSLLSLQAEKLNDKDTFQPSDILEAFRESQNRVASMALIHEELYQGKGLETLEFSAYLRRLTAELLKSYTIGESINLKLELEPVYLDMDTAVPLGIIVNELISNALKYAFPAGKGGVIRVGLSAIKDNYRENESETGCKNEGNFQFILIVADNGTGISGSLDFRNTDSLGLQIVNLLVEQIDGCIELKRDSGTEFKIMFNTQENEGKRREL